MSKGRTVYGMANSGRLGFYLRLGDTSVTVASVPPLVRRGAGFMVEKCTRGRSSLLGRVERLAT